MSNLFISKTSKDQFPGLNNKFSIISLYYGLSKVAQTKLVSKKKNNSEFIS